MKKTIIALTTTLAVTACGMLGGKGGQGINMYTVQQDKDLGAQVAQEIASNPTEYPIVDSAANPELYAYIYKVRNKILNSGKVAHKDDFQWRVQIINKDSVLNAFCTPGGYIYVYTGIMKYLDSEDELAGVLGHEIAHADLRHSTRQMTTMYGVDAVLGAISGNKEMVKQITSGLIGLKFSRDHESEADLKSVEYLCPTDYNANGGGKFFEKITAAGGGKSIEFLSTHPNPDKRIESYNNKKAELGCQGTKDFKAEYAAMKKRLSSIKPKSSSGGNPFNMGTKP
jgi:predicted Zn-dependent protease